jgi:hypothetical protein
MRDFLLLVEDAFSIAAPTCVRTSFSEKLLSQNLFAKASDFSVRLPTDLEKIDLMREARVLFVKSEYLNEALEIIGATSNTRVVLVGDSDIDWNYRLENLPKNVKKIYLQNFLDETDDRHSVLPIGIEGRNWARNGLPHLFGKFYSSQAKSDRVLVGPFSETHDERKVLRSNFPASNQKIEVVSKRISSFQYAYLSSKFRFIACPRGNGQDTHRFWESIYRGSRPIVLRSQWSENLRSQIGSCFDEVEEWTEQSLAEIVSNLSKARARADEACPKAFWNYWRREINSFL